MFKLRHSVVSHGSSKVSTDAQFVLPSGGLEELPCLCSLYIGPSAQELARTLSQTGLALVGPLFGLTMS